MLSNADAADEGSWQYYGGDAGGSRYSPLDEIKRDNVTRLEAAWEYRTSDYADGSGGMRKSKFETTPILFGGKLFFSMPFSRIIALDPATGREVWIHNPEVDLYQPYSESLVSRGVAAWQDEPPGAAQRCASRILFATLDARFLAVDADEGMPCLGLGSRGYVDLTAGVGPVEVGEYRVTSPPIVLGYVFVVGSAIGANRRVPVERGTVRGSNARSGDLICPSIRSRGAPITGVGFLVARRCGHHRCSQRVGAHVCRSGSRPRVRSDGEPGARFLRRRAAWRQPGWPTMSSRRCRSRRDGLVAFRLP